MILQDICNRCSKFSGWNLVVTVKDGKIWFRDPDANGQSWLIVYLHPIFGLTEAYGRMRHWAITPEERELMRTVLSPDPVCAMCREQCGDFGDNPDLVVV